jgi:primosomal protein N' (replication factor Y)
MPIYLEVAVNVPQVAEVFHYHAPPELEGQIKVGNLVAAPFGAQHVQGVVLRFVETPAVPQTKPILSLLDPQPVVTPVQIQLAQELAQNSISSLATFIDLMLPPGLGQFADTLYTIRRSQSAATLRPLSETQLRLMTLLDKRGGSLRGRQIDQALPRINWRPAARSLMQGGLLSTQFTLPPPAVRPKHVRTAQLACSPQEAEKAMPTLAKEGTLALQRRQAMLRYLLHEPGPVDVAWLYAESAGNLTDLKHLAQLGLVALGESQVWRDPLQDYSPVISEPPLLTKDQLACWLEIEKGLRVAGGGIAVQPYLLHGVTGSGKTELYLRAVEATLQAGKQAIVLVPEISLTPQTVSRFTARFPGQVGLVHSRLSPGERYDTWRRARDGQLSVVIGPRSALFTPFPNPGLIVLDECHDDSYYQSDPPFYHAVEAAIAYARLAGGVCLLGSATPDITSAYRAAQGRWHYLRLPARILAHRQTVKSLVDRLGQTSRYQPFEEQAETIELPPVEVVDMRQELKEGNLSIFSRQLQAALGEVLALNQQAILFLNRRGTATYVFCRDCGHNLKCPRCDTPLTFHTPAETLTCHYCGYQRKMVQTCPQCGSRRIRQYGAGTEKVEAEIQALFPQARTLRWDYDTTRKKGAHEIILSHFIAHRADVLIGTQMLAKGLDLPLVTLVGVVLADVGLNLPDYRAAERTFQVLTQVAGRAGRSPLAGKALLQTFQPESYVIQAAAKHSYHDFYKQELEFRRQLRYPPFTSLARLEYRHRDANRARSAAEKLASQIRTWIAEEDRRATEIAGPVPCFFSRLSGYYRWQVVLRGPDPISLLRGRPLGDWRVELNPPSLL